MIAQWNGQFQLVSYCLVYIHSCLKGHRGSAIYFTPFPDHILGLDRAKDTLA